MKKQSKILKKQIVLLAGLSLMLTSCVTSTLNDYCLITRPEWIGSIEEAAVYDCLCAEDKIDKECE